MPVRNKITFHPKSWSKISAENSKILLWICISAYFKIASYIEHSKLNYVFEVRKGIYFLHTFFKFQSRDSNDVDLRVQGWSMTLIINLSSDFSLRFMKVLSFQKQIMLTFCDRPMIDLFLFRNINLFTELSKNVLPLNTLHVHFLAYWVPNASQQ